MSTQRVERINEMIRQEVAASLFRIVNEEGFDHSAVTVTHVITSPDLRHARVFVSVRGDESKKQDILRKLARHRKDFQSSVARNVVMKYTPHLAFELDESIARGDHVLDLISKMEREHPEWVPPKPNES
jgi:ribosome-binding factor A